MKTVQIKTEVTVNELAEQIAGVYNNYAGGWDYQHGGQSRSYGEVCVMCSDLDNHHFTAKDIKHAIEHNIDQVNEMNDVMTVIEWAEFIADMVAKKVVDNQYGDVTFTITLKK